MSHPQHDTDHPKRGVVAVIVRGDKLLVIRRSQYVRAPGMYCFPGGGMHADETEEFALVRELREELNVDVLPRRKLWHSVTPWNVSLDWWFTELPETAELRPDPREVESVHWLSRAEIRALPELLQSNHDFLDALERGEFGW